MNQQQINDLTKRCYEAAKAKGWHEQQRTNNEFILLIQSEMFECFDAYRSQKYCEMLNFDSNESMPFKTNYETHIKGTFDEELADTAIRIFDCAGASRFEIQERFYKGGNASFIATFTEFVKFSTCMLDDEIHAGNLGYLLMCVIEIAMQNEIDLLRHIELKLEYNKTCEIRHGNKIL